MARSLPAQGTARGERIGNDALAQLTSDDLYIIGFQRIVTQYGPTNLAELRDEQTGELYHTFLSEGVGQRDTLVKMFGESDEPVGPVRLVAAPTKAGRSVWMFQPVGGDTVAPDDLPF